ncbi:MAG: PKD domain-containing protein [Methanoregula sp.]|nr:PKD domain-containing protein [Methanoregula sp.]
MKEYPQSQITLRPCILLLLLISLSCILPVSALLQIPVANFTADPQEGPAQEPVQFTDASTGTPVSWYWDFGDGTRSTLQNPRHTYSYLGVYTVSLTVMNAAGNTSVSKEIYMADSGTPVPTTIPPASLPRTTETPKSPVGIAIVLAAPLIALLLRPEKQ